MLKIEIILDDEKIAREGYDIYDVINIIDKRFIGKCFTKTQDPQKLIYSNPVHGDNEYAQIWNVILNLARTNWFQECVKDWNCYSSIQGADFFEVESLMDLFSKEYCN